MFVKVDARKAASEVGWQCVSTLSPSNECLGTGNGHKELVTPCLAHLDGWNCYSS